MSALSVTLNAGRRKLVSSEKKCILYGNESAIFDTHNRHAGIGVSDDIRDLKGTKSNVLLRYQKPEG